VELVRDGQLDLAVLPRRHRRSGGAGQVAAPRQNSGRLLRRQPTDPHDRQAGRQVDTLVMTNASMRRAERVAFPTLQRGVSEFRPQQPAALGEVSDAMRRTPAE
jgi:hypothetical protein